MIIVMGYVHVAPTDVNEFVNDVRVLIANTKTHKGCLFYSVAVDDAAAGRMLVVERWQDQASLTSHLETHRTATFLEKWMTRVKSDVLKYDASNERSLMD